MEDRFFTIEHDGINLKVATTYRRRDDETLLLLHGLGCSRESFKDIWSCNELSGYSILTLDLIGFGQSSKSERFSYKLEDHAAVCAKIWSEYHVGQIHIVAHSMGGAIGLLLPPALLKAALTFSNLEGNLSSEDRGIVSQKTTTVSMPVFESRVWPEIKALSKSLGEGRFFLESAMPAAFYKSAASLVQWSNSGKLLTRFKNLPCRKAYFYSEQNSHRLALHRLASIETIGISRSGHFLMNDNPAEFYPRLKTFLKPTGI